jgi:hypothetical protein
MEMGVIVNVNLSNLHNQPRVVMGYVKYEKKQMKRVGWTVDVVIV